TLARALLGCIHHGDQAYPLTRVGHGQVWQNPALRQAAAAYEARFEICVHIDTSLLQLTQSPREKQFRTRQQGASSFNLLFVFSLCERKNEQQKGGKVPLRPPTGGAPRKSCFLKRYVLAPAVPRRVAEGRMGRPP